MKPDKLIEMIDSLAGDIEFMYNGKHGAVCPFSRTDISVSYGDDEHSHICVEDVMNDKMFDGKCLNEIADQISIM